jgi:DNA-binding NarL/FixJ family response regulator
MISPTQDESFPCLPFFQLAVVLSSMMIGRIMGTERLRIIIVDDHQGFINAVKIFIRNRHGIEVVGEANNAFQFQEIMKTTVADIILMDINLPETDGLDAGKIALMTDRELKVLGVTMSDDYNIHFNMLQNGFSGGILKNQFTQDFDKAINKIKNGEVYFPILNK